MTTDQLLSPSLLHPPTIDEESYGLPTHLLPNAPAHHRNRKLIGRRWLPLCLERLWLTLTFRGTEIDFDETEGTDASSHDQEEGHGERKQQGFEQGEKPKVSVKNLERKVENLQILKGVTVDMKAGSVVGIIGPSGSGKSTFLRALNRLWEPSPGTVFLDDVDITSLKVLDVRRRVGMLFQTPALFEGTVADNVRYGPSLAGNKLGDSQVEEFLRIADLNSSFASKSVNGLSVGEAQRVALARTLANNPEVLLLDEPTSALDPISTGKIEDAVNKLSEKGLTIIIVSHSVNQIKKITSLVCVFVDGELVEKLRPEELQNSKHPLIRQFIEAS